MRTRARTIVLSIGLSAPVAFVLAAGCVDTAHDCVLVRDLGATCKPGDSSASVGGGGSSTSITTSTMNTGGTGGGCSKDSDCPATAPPGPCADKATPTCTNHKCGFTYTAGPSSSQQFGSCKQGMCDAMGVFSLEEANSNAPDDGNPCTKDSCMSGTPSSALDPGATCTLSGGGQGTCAADPVYMTPSCAECVTSTTCSFNPGYTCVANKCVPPHCTNGVKDSGETDKDCGGITGCPSCIAGKTCSTYQDCASQVCTGGICQVATCSDVTQNQGESDKDCGGPCLPCGDGLRCFKPSDCKNGVCRPNMPGMPAFCQSPTCTDGVQNGDEEGIDCGGPTSMCPPCPM